MWVEDLHAGPFTQSTIVHVGWLSCGKPYRVGEVDRNVHEKLVELVESGWEPFAAGGFHQCDLCDGPSKARGATNCYIPGNGKIYYCPELILHYISIHHYAPPDEFCQAVLACPPMGTGEYFAALRACGGDALIRSAGGHV